LIENGKIEVRFYDRDLVPRFTFAPFPFSLIVKLSDVSFVFGDSNDDPFYSADPKRVHTSRVFMLDFSIAITKIKKPKRKLFGPEYNAWLKSPYVVCCIDTTMTKVWEEFALLVRLANIPRA
jgi:hypothetical protein